MRNRLLAAAWGSWLDLHLTFINVRAAARAWKEGALAKGWRTWRAFVYQRTRLHTLGTIMINRLRNALLTKVRQTARATHTHIRIRMPCVRVQINGWRAAARAQARGRA